MEGIHAFHIVHEGGDIVPLGLFLQNFGGDFGHTVELGGIDPESQVAEETVVDFSFAIHLEMPGHPGRTEDFRHIAADAQGLALDEAVILVKVEIALIFLHGAEISGAVAVVLFPVLQTRALESTDGAGEELDVTHHPGDFKIIGLDGGFVHHIIGGKTALRHEAAEILQIHGTAHALAPHDGVIFDLFGNPPVRKHVGEAELTTLLQDPVNLGENQLLEGGQGDDAVGGHHIDGVVLDA